jgi:hypothetical protein
VLSLLLKPIPKTKYIGILLHNLFTCTGETRQGTKAPITYFFIVIRYGIFEKLIIMAL